MQKIGAWLLLFYVGILPFYFQVLYKAIPHLVGFSPRYATVFKEGILFLATVILLISRTGHPLRLRLWVADIMAFFFVLYLVLMIPETPSKSTAFFGLRVFAQPLLIYFLARSLPVSILDIKRIFAYFLFAGGCISIWALFQVLFLGDAFLINLGYEEQLPGKLAESFYLGWGLFIHRAASTFSSPNVYAFFLHLITMAGIFLFRTHFVAPRTIFYPIMAVLMAGMVYSFSRSFWFALFVSFVTFQLLEGDILAHFALVAKGIFAGAVLTALILALDFGLIRLVREHLWRTFLIKDASSVAHLTSWKNSVAFLMDEPLGIGLGLTGARVPFFGKEVAALSESSFFTLAFDTGIFGLLLYVFFWLAVLIRLLALRCQATDSAVRTLLSVTVATIVGQLVAWSFLAYILDLEVVMLLFFFVGLAQNVAEKPMERGP